jgi:MFS family permease
VSQSQFFIFLGLLTATFYLPLWYQATRGASATKSGIDILPYMLSVVVAAGISGGIITKSGRYWPFLLGSPLLLSIGGGLLYTVAVATPNARVIGFQILYGIGVGGALTNSLMAIQAEFVAKPEMIAQGTSLVSFTQLLGGVIGIAISGTVFANQLRSHIASIGGAAGGGGGLTLSSEMAKAVVASVTVIQTLPDELKGAVINAYVQSLRPIFLIAVPAGVFASMCAL